jgi:hypothetical protein
MPLKKKWWGFLSQGGFPLKDTVMLRGSSLAMTADAGFGRLAIGSEFGPIRPIYRAC